jgi:hypothetical protein
MDKTGTDNNWLVSYEDGSIAVFRNMCVSLTKTGRWETSIQQKPNTYATLALKTLKTKIT